MKKGQEVHALAGGKTTQLHAPEGCDAQAGQQLRQSQHRDTLALSPQQADLFGTAVLADLQKTQQSGLRTMQPANSRLQLPARVYLWHGKELQSALRRSISPAVYLRMILNLPIHDRR